MKLFTNLVLGMAALGIGMNEAVAKADMIARNPDQGRAVATRTVDDTFTTRATTTVEAAAQQKVKYDHTQYSEALQTSAKTGRPLVFKIGASWCGPCKRMAREAFANRDVQKLLKSGAVFVEITVDRVGDTRAEQEWAKKLAMSFNPRGYPTTVIATLKKNAAGKLVPVVQKQKTAFMTASQLKSYLGYLPQAKKIMQANGFGVAR